MERLKMMNETFAGSAENFLFTCSVILYVLSCLGYIVYSVSKDARMGKWGSILIRLAFIGHSLAILFRGIGAGRLPLSNQYEFATGFSWGIALFYIIFERKHGDRSLGAFVSPIAFLLIGYAALQNKEIRPLMPALQSGWLGIHVSLAILSYGGFALACGLSVKYLASGKADREGHLSPALLENYSYRLVVVGYVLLTLTILTGALWAQKAWGRYWSWDPKETWSLVTWLIYTAYLHMRKIRNMKGKKAAWFLVIGFICVIFTYIGVNTLLPSLHSYV